ncbi:MAG: iron-containing alcohol dehydrogenase [Chloroflexaceae bacterium]
MRFEFATAGRIIFGAGALREAGALAAALGRRALVVGGANPDRLAPLLETLRATGVALVTFAVAGEPTVEAAAAGAALARAEGCDLVVAMGGGSALDAGKAIAALATNPGDPLDYLEVVGRGQPLVAPPLPCVAIPTTAGTGSEVTRNAVLGVPAEKVKVSLRSPLMLPRVALIDPELTYGLPAAITASTGMDALTQCLEPFVSPAATPLTDGPCREGLRRAGRSLQRACYDGSDREAREDMALASLCGGLALANARLGAVHGFAAPLGGMYAAPHGAICARLLGPVMAANIGALRKRAPHSPALARYAAAARLLTGEPAATAEQGAVWATALADELGIPRLAAYGISTGDFPAIVARASRASSMQGNPITLSDEELTAILHAAL